MSQETSRFSKSPPIVVPFGLKDHFEGEPQAAYRFVDPTDPGHDYFDDPESASTEKNGFLARVLGR